MHRGQWQFLRYLKAYVYLCIDSKFVDHNLLAIWTAADWIERPGSDLWLTWIVSRQASDWVRFENPTGRWRAIQSEKDDLALNGTEWSTQARYWPKCILKFYKILLFDFNTDKLMILSHSRLVKTTSVSRTEKMSTNASPNGSHFCIYFK